MICENCGKKFHACSNCGFLHSWEYDFCSWDCAKNIFLKKAQPLVDIVSKLSEEDKKILGKALKEVEEEVLEFAGKLICGEES